MTTPLLLPFDSSAATLARAGGKGANLSRLVDGGFPVPPGFIITTAAYDAFVACNHLAAVVAMALAGVTADSPAVLTAASETLRTRFRDGRMPAAVANAVLAAYTEYFGDGAPVAVRSSATAEDLPDLSFAGQQDTFLNVAGPDALLDAVIRCWSSLWTARAIGYRAHNDIPQESVALAVVVQAMVQAEAAGVLFTANPLNGRRTESAIDATLGLGEALVSGQVEPDHYLVETLSGRIVEKHLGTKVTATESEHGDRSVVHLALLVAALDDGSWSRFGGWDGRAGRPREAGVFRLRYLSTSGSERDEQEGDNQDDDQKVPGEH